MRTHQELSSVVVLGTKMTIKRRCRDDLIVKGRKRVHIPWEIKGGLLAKMSAGSDDGRKG